MCFKNIFILTIKVNKYDNFQLKLKLTSAFLSLPNDVSLCRIACVFTEPWMLQNVQQRYMYQGIIILKALYM